MRSLREKYGQRRKVDCSVFGTSGSDTGTSKRNWDNASEIKENLRRCGSLKCKWWKSFKDRMTYYKRSNKVRSENWLLDL